MLAFLLEALSELCEDPSLSAGPGCVQIACGVQLPDGGH